MSPVHFFSVARQGRVRSVCSPWDGTESRDAALGRGTSPDLAPETLTLIRAPACLEDGDRAVDGVDAENGETIFFERDYLFRRQVCFPLLLSSFL